MRCARERPSTRLGELEILGSQLFVGQRVVGTTARAGRERDERAAVVQRDLHARPSLGWKQARILAALSQSRDTEQAPHPRIGELR